MKILVFSDVHGDTRGMERAILAHGDADAAVFLGDGWLGAEEVFLAHPHLPHTAVIGNCDSQSAGVCDAVLELGGVRILCTHGHRYGVKLGRGRLARAAKEKGASLVFYGHTHVAVDETVDGVRMINPGSVGCGSGKSYAVVYIENGAVVCGFGKGD